MPLFCTLVGNTSDGEGSLEMNGASVPNGTSPPPINIFHRSFRNFPESFGKWKTLHDFLLWKIISEAGMTNLGGLPFMSYCNYDVNSLQINNFPVFYRKVSKE